MKKQINFFVNIGFEVIFLKEGKCVSVGDHKNVGEVIEEWQKNGWRLHTYACAGIGAMMAVNHYLLFEKGE